MHLSTAVQVRTIEGDMRMAGLNVRGSGRLLHLALAALFVLAPTIAGAQTMSFSVYNDPNVGYGWVQNDAYVIDFSSGCSHWGYETTVRVQSPSYRLATGVNQGLSGSASLDTDSEFGDYTAVTTTRYSCSCIHGGTATYGGSTTVPVPAPTTASPHFWGALSGTPSGCASAPYYWYVRDYQVKDQAGQPITRVMQISETMSNQTPNCVGVTITTGGGPSLSNGTFRDNLYLCDSSVCNSGGSCSFGRDQTFKADGASLSPVFQQSYTCSTASVTP
jgi:hypothetical protein